MDKLAPVGRLFFAASLAASARSGSGIRPLPSGGVKLASAAYWSSACAAVSATVIVAACARSASERPSAACGMTAARAESRWLVIGMTIAIADDATIATASAI